MKLFSHKIYCGYFSDKCKQDILSVGIHDIMFLCICPLNLKWNHSAFYTLTA